MIPAGRPWTGPGRRASWQMLPFEGDTIVAIGTFALPRAPDRCPRSLRDTRLYRPAHPLSDATVLETHRCRAACREVTTEVSGTAGYRCAGPGHPRSLSSSSASTTARTPSAGPSLSEFAAQVEEQGMWQHRFLAGHGNAAQARHGLAAWLRRPRRIWPGCALSPAETLEEVGRLASHRPGVSARSYATHAEIAPGLSGRR